MTKRNPAYVAALCLLIVFIAAANCHAATADPNVPKTPAFRPPADEKKAKLWALGCAGVLMERNWARHDTLETGPLTDVRISDERKLISDWWNVENRADLLEALRGVEVRGHRKAFEADGRKAAEGVGLMQTMKLIADPERANDLKIAGQYYQKLGDKGLLGWDFSRYICLCRWGYTAGYISEEEAWEKIMPAARLLQKHFTSWNELGENYLIGRRYWSANQTQESEPEYIDAMTRLLESKASPWVTMPWNTDLGDGPVLGEPWSKGRTITVGQDANSISAAIEIAAAGDTVYIPSGLYKESGIKLKDGIRIIGDGMRKTIIQGDPNNGWVITATDCSGSIEAITVEQTGVTAVRRDSGGIFIRRGSVEVLECEARGTAWEGIAMRGCPASVIRDCRATGNQRYGLLVRSDNSDTRIIGCTAKDNGQEGIYVKCGGKGLIHWNSATSNGGHGIQVGSDMNGSFTITRNKAGRNKKTGILAANVVQVGIDENVSEDNEGNGLYVLTAEKASVIRKNWSGGNGSYAIYSEKTSADIGQNSIYGNYGGIYTYDCPTATVRQNRIAGCTEKPAITAQDIVRFEADENECTDNKSIGIFVTGKSSAAVKDNKCSDGDRDGIQFSREASGTITRNWCQSNNGRGISVYGTGPGVTVMNNRCLQNRNGISVFGAADVSIKDNLINDNLDYGLQVASGGRVRADGNTCGDNGLHGIYVSDPNTTALLKWNKCTGSNYAGIMFANGAGGEANGNMCSGNSWCGIGIRGESTSPVLTKNHCNDNGAWGIIAWAGATLGSLPADNITEGNFKGGVMTRDQTPDPNE